MERAALVALALAVASCGYSVRAMTPSGIRTVAVPVAHNNTFRRLNELFLTRAVVREIQTKTELQVVERERADSVLEMTIIRIRTPVLTEDLVDTPTELAVNLTVTVRWTDLRTGETLLDRPVTGSQDFRPPQGENLDTGFERTFDSTARRIVEEMDSTDW